MNKVVVINVKDLIYYLLSKWRVIVVAMLLGGILLNGYEIVKLYRTENAAQQEVDYDMELKKAKELLSESDAELVENTYEMYKMYRTNYNQLSDYCSNSIKMQIDPNAVNTMVVQYYVDNHYEAIYPVVEGKDTTEDIVSSLQNIIIDQDSLSEMKSKLNLDINNNYLSELISFGSNTSKDTTDSTLKITIIGTDQGFCTTIADVIDQSINSHVEELRQVYGEFDIHKMADVFSVRADSNLLYNSQTQLNSLSSAKNSMTNIKSGLSENQASYFSLLSKNDAQKNKQDDTKADTVTNTKISIKDVGLIHKKKMVIGFLLGIILSAGYYFLLYVFGDKIRYADDLKISYNVPVLATVASEEKQYKNIIDKKIYKARYGEITNKSKEERMEMLISAIKMAVEQKNCKSICVMSSAELKQELEIMETISSRMKDQCEIHCFKQSFVYDAKNLETACKSDGVIFIEQIGKSTYKGIEKQVNICRQYSIDILGSSVIQE